MREVMLQFSDHGVVITAPDRTPVISAIDLRVQRPALRRWDGQRVLVEQDVVRQTSLVAQRCDETVSQIILRVEGIVMDPHSGHGAGPDGNTNCATRGQSIGTEA